MFGDLFSQRGNYLDGMFYRGHMKYLREQEPNETASALMPPDEFKTRRQMRHTGKTGDLSQDHAKNFQIKFQKSEENHHNHHGHGASRFKKSAHVLQGLIMFEHFSSNHEEDWICRNEAGVVMWINKGTGEVSTVRPWGDPHVAPGKNETAASLSLIHPSYSKSGDSLDIPRRITQLKDGGAQDVRDSKPSTPTPRMSMLREAQDYKMSTSSPRSSAIRPSTSGSTSSPRLSLRPATAAASPRTTMISNARMSVRHGDAKMEAKSDHLHLPPLHHSTPSHAHLREHHLDAKDAEHRQRDEPICEHYEYDDHLRDAEEVEYELGTGSLVYDRSEVDNFFALLDGMK